MNQSKILSITIVIITGNLRIIVKEKGKLAIAGILTLALAFMVGAPSSKTLTWNNFTATEPIQNPNNPDMASLTLKVPNTTGSAFYPYSYLSGNTPDLNLKFYMPMSTCYFEIAARQNGIDFAEVENDYKFFVANNPKYLGAKVLNKTRRIVLTNLVRKTAKFNTYNLFLIDPKGNIHVGTFNLASKTKLSIHYVPSVKLTKSLWNIGVNTTAAIQKNLSKAIGKKFFDPIFGQILSTLEVPLFPFEVRPVPHIFNRQVCTGGGREGDVVCQDAAIVSASDVPVYLTRPIADLNTVEFMIRPRSFGGQCPVEKEKKVLTVRAAKNAIPVTLAALASSPSSTTVPVAKLKLNLVNTGTPVVQPPTAVTPNPTPTPVSSPVATISPVASPKSSPIASASPIASPKFSPSHSPSPSASPVSSPKPRASASSPAY